MLSDVETTGFVHCQSSSATYFRAIAQILDDVLRQLRLFGKTPQRVSKSLRRKIEKSSSPRRDRRLLRRCIRIFFPNQMLCDLFE